MSDKLVPKDIPQSAPKLVKFSRIEQVITVDGKTTPINKKVVLYKDSEGQKIAIEKKVLDLEKISIDTASFKMLPTKYSLNDTGIDQIYFFYLKVPNIVDEQLKKLKTDLIKGISWQVLNRNIQESILDISEADVGEYGKLISINIPAEYKTRNQYRINIYPGKSVKNSGFNGLSLLEYIDKNQDRLVFRSFKRKEKPNKLYYRFYLKKI